jgi:muconolactone delta-isomerase
MFYLVVSTPHPSRPEDVKNVRLEFRSWINELIAQNKVICFYPRVGRGSIVIFDVSSNDELHEFMTQWLNIVPVSFDIYPLTTPSEADRLLKSGTER